MAITDTFTGTASRPLDRPLVLRKHMQAASLAGAATLTRLSPRMIALDPGGANRNVTLPTGVDGDLFVIYNSADAAENLVIKNPATTTIATLSRGMTGIFVCSAGTWVVLQAPGTAGALVGDTIDELTSGAGVTIDGLLIKDDSIRPDAITDPGNAGAIPVTKSGYCALVSAGAETRTLAAPSFIGQHIVLYFKTDGGDCVVTCSTTINETGNNTITFDNTGEAISLFAVEEGANLRWRCAVADGAGLTTV